MPRTQQRHPQPSRPVIHPDPMQGPRDATTLRASRTTEPAERARANRAITANEVAAKRAILGVPLLAAGVLSSALAHAQLWDPLDVLPRPNAIVGIDSSVTMGITADCPQLSRFKRPTVDGEEFFADGHAICSKTSSSSVASSTTGCGYAKIENRAVPPIRRPRGPYARLQTLIANADSCDTRERYFEDMGEPSPPAASQRAADETTYVRELIEGPTAGSILSNLGASNTAWGPTGIPAEVNDPCAW